jgi:hypothetical protein
MRDKTKVVFVLEEGSHMHKSIEARCHFNQSSSQEKVAVVSCRSKSILVRPCKEETVESEEKVELILQMSRRWTKSLWELSSSRWELSILVPCAAVTDAAEYKAIMVMVISV